MYEKHIGSEYLTSKDFSEIVGMSVAALRSYDSQGIFRPAVRGKKHENNYRYYSPVQITMIKMCRLLLDIGFPKSIIQELEKKKSPELAMKLLRKHRESVEMNRRRLAEALSVIDIYMEYIGCGISASESELSLCEMKEQRYVMGERNRRADAAGFFDEYVHFISEPQEGGLNRAYPVGGYFYNMTSFLDNPAMPNHFISMNPNGQGSKPPGLYLVGYTRGYYGVTNSMPERMARYAEQKGLVFVGPVYNIYLLDELCVDDPDRYLLQVSVPVKETRCSPSRRAVIFPLVGAVN